MNENDTGMVSMELDLERPSPFSEEEVSQLRVLAAMRNEAIDLSDIPLLPADKKWYRPGRVDGRRPDVVPLDADVLEFFQGEGSPDVTRVNAALREYMQTHAK
jgi:uncharacterized protein (DUF4415 family)